ncbi:hypothetical protein D3C72_2129100 [compost metagenome]
MELELALLRRALSLEQQSNATIDYFAVGLGFVVEPHHQPVTGHLDLLQLTGVGSGQATDHQPHHDPDDCQ